ncbi:MAG: hypothetical protein QGI86_01080 [Candidatus Poribacteria bacterium]|nr:hypothetical protein [Candidatus Poribacteria bacterium]MDP6748919.1 hypothetical protein [Candidatus Poribacteria bacterium]MDP6997220.1 hypothetical protein [Candidatus Poribacteria bacterium]
MLNYTSGSWSGFVVSRATHWIYNGILLICLMILPIFLMGCLASLSTQWSDNLMLAPDLEVTDQRLVDGNLETVAIALPPQKNKDRAFVIKFPQPQSIRRLIIHNQNLLMFSLEYLEPKTNKWEIAHSVRSRNFDRNGHLQTKFVIDRLRFTSSMIRIKVNRTIDDRIVTKTVVNPDDHVINVIKRTFAGRYAKFFRVLAPSLAAIREVEAYKLAQ